MEPSSFASSQEVTMNILIDCKGLKEGGGVTHIKNLLEQLSDIQHKSEKILLYNYHGTFPSGYSMYRPIKFFGLNLTYLSFLLGCNFDVLFTPSGRSKITLKPSVTMCRNMLVFDRKERARFRYTKDWYRFVILEWLQLFSFARAKKIIFLNDYAQNYVCRRYPFLKKKSVIIPHGKPDISHQWSNHKELIKFDNDPYRLIYVSTLNYYKHQHKVVEAVSLLRDKGYNIDITLVGGARDHYLRDYGDFLSKSFVRYLGKLSFAEIESEYKKANLAVFASSCENLPNVLMEKIACGIPVVVSDIEPMNSYCDIKDSHFNHEFASDIAQTIEQIGSNIDLQKMIIDKSRFTIQDYSWYRTALETITTIEQCVVL